MMPAVDATCSGGSVSALWTTRHPTDPDRNRPLGRTRAGRSLPHRERRLVGCEHRHHRGVRHRRRPPVTLKIVRPELAVHHRVPPGVPSPGRGRDVAVASEHRAGARLGRDRARRRVHAVLGRRVPRRRQPPRPLRPGPTARAVAGARRRPRSVPGARRGPRAAASCTPSSRRRSSCSARTAGCGSSTSPWPQLLGAEAWSEPATVATHVARYASPEQALGLEVDAKTDVYALSLCLIEAITGSVPFAGDSTVSTLAARVGKLMPVTADMGSLAAVLERGGRPEGEDRWTAAEFARRSSRPPRASRGPSRSRCMAASLFATSLAAASSSRRRGRARRRAGAAEPPDSSGAPSRPRCGAPHRRRERRTASAEDHRARGDAAADGRRRPTLRPTPTTPTSTEPRRRAPLPMRPHRVADADRSPSPMRPTDPTRATRRRRRAPMR